MHIIVPPKQSKPPHSVADITEASKLTNYILSWSKLEWSVNLILHLCYVFWTLQTCLHSLMCNLAPAQVKWFASLDMPVFVSQVLISFITLCWGIPKPKIVPASDYGPHLLHPPPTQARPAVHIPEVAAVLSYRLWGEFRLSQTAACATSAGTMAGWALKQV